MAHREEAEEYEFPAGILESEDVGFKTDDLCDLGLLHLSPLGLVFVLIWMNRY